MLGIAGIRSPREARFGGVWRADRRTRGRGLRPVQVALHVVVRPRWWRRDKSAIDCFWEPIFPIRCPGLTGKQCCWQTVLSLLDLMKLWVPCRSCKYGDGDRSSALTFPPYYMPCMYSSDLESLQGGSRHRGIRKALKILLPGGARWPLYVAMGTGPQPPPVLLGEKAPL